MGSDIPVLDTCVISLLVGFWFFNKSPAKLYMGDSGSYICGAILGSMALMDKNHPVLFAIINLPLVLQIGSSLMQMIWIKLLDRKLFAIAPIHHLLIDKGFNRQSIAYICNFWTIAAYLLRDTCLIFAKNVTL